MSENTPDEYLAETGFDVEEWDGDDTDGDEDELDIEEERSR